jgi:hypothetical protein
MVHRAFQIHPRPRGKQDRAGLWKGVGGHRASQRRVCPRPRESGIGTTCGRARRQSAGASQHRRHPSPRKRGIGTARGGVREAEGGLLVPGPPESPHFMGPLEEGGLSDGPQGRVRAWTGCLGADRSGCPPHGPWHGPAGQDAPTSGPNAGHRPEGCIRTRMTRHAPGVRREIRVLLGISPVRCASQ